MRPSQAPVEAAQPNEPGAAEEPGAAASSAASPGWELLVAGLPEGLAEEEIRDLFGIHGSVREARIAAGPGGRFCVVTYEDEEGAQAAIEHMHGHELLDAKLEVRARVGGEAPWEPVKARPTAPSEPRDWTGCDLVIFHVPKQWADEDLRRVCEPHGQVLSATVMKDRGPAQAFGLVRFSDRVQAAKALASLQGRRADAGQLMVEVKSKDFQRQLLKASRQPPIVAAAAAAAPTAAVAAPRPAALTRMAGVAAAAAAAAGPAPASKPAEGGGGGGPVQEDQIEVPRQMVRLLIGKDGTTIRHLRRESQARIEFAKEASEASEERAVLMSGVPTALARARRLIQLTLRGAREVRPGDPNADMVVVGQSLCRMVIGAAGETISRIRKDSGARIEVVKDDLEPDCRLIIISGPDECVEYAREQLQEVLSGAEDRDAAAAAGDGASTSRSHFEVPEEHVGRVMGRGGENINKISRETGVKISSRRRGAGGSGRTLQLSGEPEKLEEAKRLLEASMQGREQRERAVWRGEKERVVTLPAGRTGAFIGKGGEHIHRLSEATGCRVSVPPNQDGGDRKVHLTGTAEALERAGAAIQGFLEKGSWDALGEVLGSTQDACIEGLVSERVYVDEVPLPGRQKLWKDSEDGLPYDTEIFVKGLPAECQEKQIWSHLCSLGLSDVVEILLLRRAGKSKGMAYVLFRHHESAVVARSKLHGAPAASLPASKGSEAPPTGHLTAWLSESERCVKGRQGVYGSDVLGVLLGTKGANVTRMKTETGLKKVVMSGAGMQSYGRVDEEPRLHLVVFYKQGEEDFVAKAYEAWSTNLSNLHKELAVKRDGAGQKLGGKAPAKEAAEVMPIDQPPPDQAQRQEQLEDDDTEPPEDLFEDDFFGLEDPAAGGEAVEEDLDQPGGEEAPLPPGVEAEVEEPPPPEASSLTISLREGEGGRERFHEVLSGEYVEFGEHQARPVYRKAVPGPGAGGAEAAPEDGSGPEVYLYFLDPSAGDEAPCASWWLGSAIGGDEVWACCADEALEPPEGGWELLCEGDEGAELSILPTSQVSVARKRRRRSRRRHRQRERTPAPPPAPAAAWEWRPPGLYDYGRVPPPQLPRPWIAMPHGSLVYYVNQETGERSWYPPPAAPWPSMPAPAPQPAPQPSSHRSRRHRSRSTRRASGGGGGKTRAAAAASAEAAPAPTSRAR